MPSFESQHTITHDIFVASAEECLGAAIKPETSVQQAHDNAQMVATKLAAVQSGELVVQPPLTGEQIASFKDRTDTILAISGKALSTLAATQESGSVSRREARRRRREQESQSRFTGTADASKM